MRAGLVALAMAVGLADGCPLPTSTQAPGALREPVRVLKEVRHVALTPFRPLGELLRLRQRWKLFPTAKREQVRMWIETRDAATGAWSVVYRPQDEEHTVLANPLEYRRIRAAWNPGSKGARTGYGPFVDWVAGELLAADASIDRVRVRMENILLDPEDGRWRSTGTFDHTRVVKRR